MATYSSWVVIVWSIFDACYTSEHPFFSGFEAEKGLRVKHACVVYTLFYGSISLWTFINFIHMIALGSKLTPPWGSQVGTKEQRRPTSKFFSETGRDRA